MPANLLAHLHTSTFCLRTSYQHAFTFSHLKTHCRNYAFSRFPNRTVGPGRKQHERFSPESTHRRTDPRLQSPAERALSEEVSQLWHTSQRPPSGDPKLGLENLLLENEVLVVERQIEMLNIFVGFEQSNRYSIANVNGEILGYIAEKPRGFLSLIARQTFATHRPFRSVVMDALGSPILRFRRPFAWINSRMFVQHLKDFSDYSPEGEPLLDSFGEIQQIWHPWRRRYDLFIRESPHRILSLASELQPEPELSIYRQFANVDANFLAWIFQVYSEMGDELALISRTFRGIGREIFTDTGRYYLRFGKEPSQSLEVTNSMPKQFLTLEERALCLALAVNIDFDYFSRHSRVGSGGLLHLSSME
ncbi:Scramblase-domain-containing protein [Cyathus striatus]|nr:Scramblase-domain-containing protein [Cyathus striatus]